MILRMVSVTMTTSVVKWTPIGVATTTKTKRRKAREPPQAHPVWRSRSR